MATGERAARSSVGGPWWLVVPVKPLGAAKTRLVDVPAGPRAELALAFAADTVHAVLRCTDVAGVLVVTDDDRVSRLVTSAGASAVPDGPRAGLNAALRHGIAAVRAAHPGSAVAALPGDLPALRADELSAVLAEAAGRAGRAAFLRDHSGRGTVLVAWPGGFAAPAPAFGPGSAARHRAAGLAELAAAAPTVRQDVDTLADLRRAVAHGVGARTTAAMRAHRVETQPSGWDGPAGQVQ